MEAEKFELNPEVGKNYNLAPGCPPVFENPVVGTVDIRTVSVSTVEELIKAGSDKFIAKTPPAKAKVDA